MDTETVSAAQRGDVAAFGALVDRYTRVAVAVAFVRTGRPELAAEVAQDAFLDSWRLLPTLREPAAFGAWLRRIVVKHADRATRRGGRERAELDDRTPSDDPHFDDRLDLDAHWRSVRAAMATLPVHLREVVALFYLSDRSHAEIATLLDLSIPAVKKRLHDARRRLSPALEATMNPLSDHATVSRTVRAFVAARTGHTDLLREVLDANPSLLTIRRWPDPEELESRYAPATGTLVAEAVSHGRLEALALLLDRGASSEGTVLNAAGLGREDLVEWLIARGVPATERAWHGGTALHVAARRAQTALYRRLVEAGCDPDDKDVFGRSAADWLAMAGPASEEARGRVIDAHGRPLDGGPAFVVPDRSGTPEEGIRETGIKAIDLLAPLPKAGVVRLIAGARVGKLVLIGELGRCIGPTVIAGLLDRTWDVRDFESVLRELGTWDGAVVVLGSGPEDHAALIRTALAIAEANGGWLVADDRLETGLRAASPATTVVTFGPHVHPDVLPDLADRIVLDPVRAARREYPAVDVANSRTSTRVSAEHRRIADAVRAEVSGGARAGHLLAWLTQPFRVAEDFNGRPGVRVALADTLRDTDELVSTSGDPADDLRYVGRLADRGTWPRTDGALF